MDVRNFKDFQIGHAVEILNDWRNYPILVHCTAGRDRTGLVTAVYRMGQVAWTHEAKYLDKWTYEATLKEMLRYRFKPWKHPRIMRYVANEFEEIDEMESMTEKEAKEFINYEIMEIDKVLFRYPKIRTAFKNKLSGF